MHPQEVNSSKCSSTVAAILFANVPNRFTDRTDFIPQVWIVFMKKVALSNSRFHKNLLRAILTAILTYPACFLTKMRGWPAKVAIKISLFLCLLTEPVTGLIRRFAANKVRKRKLALQHVITQISGCSILEQARGMTGPAIVAIAAVAIQ